MTDVWRSDSRQRQTLIGLPISKVKSVFNLLVSIKRLNRPAHNYHHIIFSVRRFHKTGLYRTTDRVYPFLFLQIRRTASINSFNL
jgi:hypothetical protein